MRVHVSRLAHPPIEAQACPLPSQIIRGRVHRCVTRTCCNLGQAGYLPVKRITSSSVSCSVCRTMCWAPHDCKGQTMGGAEETWIACDELQKHPPWQAVALLGRLEGNSIPCPTNLGHFHLLLGGGGADHSCACSTRHLRQARRQAGSCAWSRAGVTMGFQDRQGSTLASRGAWACGKHPRGCTLLPLPA